MNLINRSKVFIKVLGINLAVFGILFVSPAITFRVYKKFKPTVVQSIDQRAYYPTYSNKQFSIQLFKELENTSPNFRSFIGWRKEKVNFKFTNILGPYNTRKSEGGAIDNSLWFFGGSSMWGYGVSDAQTIPSHFNSLTNYPVFNFAETAWNSRQSLNQLINAIGDGHKPSGVVFYDGVNDVILQCRSDIKLLPSHPFESRIQNKLKTPPIEKRILNFILSPYISLAKKISTRSLEDNPVNLKSYNCDTNIQKARSIAKHLVNNWYVAHAISKSEGFEFYAVLQPTLYTTKTNSEYFSDGDVKLNSHKEIQFNSVYPLIFEEIEKYCKSDEDFCASIVDGTDWLSGNNNIFIDFCHINSLGNRVISKQLQSFLEI